MKEKVHFIIVDDDYGTTQYCNILIKEYVPQSNIRLFMVPEEAMMYIKSVYSEVIVDKVILLLDINMPTMSGWEFLELFELLEDKIKNQITIYIFSSSVDSHDQARAKQNKRIAGYLVKPLTKKMIEKICA